MLRSDKGLGTGKEGIEMVGVRRSGKRIKLVGHSYQLLNILLEETKDSIAFIQFLV